MANDRTGFVNEWDAKLSKLSVEALVGIGIEEQLAKNYVAQLQSLYTLQQELLASAENNHGLPRNLTEEDRKKLDEAYQALINSTDILRKQHQPSVENHDVDDKLFDIRSILIEDHKVISDIVGNKVSLPFSVAVYNSNNKVVTGDLANADTVGANVSSRIVTTVTDEEGREHTGFFTPNSVVTSPKKGEEFTTAQSMNKFALRLKDGVRMDNRNSAMSAVANLLGRGDLLAFSQNMELGTGENKQKGTFMEFAQGTDLDHCLPSDPYFSADSKTPYAPSAKVDMMDLSIIDYLCLNADRHTGNMFFRYSEPDSKTGKTHLVGLVGIDNDSSFGTKNPPADENFTRLASLEETVVISEAMAKKLESITPDLLKSVLRNQGLNEEAIEAAAERLGNLQAMLANGKQFTQQFQDDFRDYLQHQEDKTEQNPESFNRLNNFLKDPINYAKNQKIFGTTSKGKSKVGLVVIPSGAEKFLSVKALGKDCVGRLSDGNTYVYGIFGGVHMENGKSRREANLRGARLRQLAARNKVAKNASLQIRTESRQEFSGKVSTEADRFLTEAKSKTGIRGTSPEFEKIRKTLEAISALSKKFTQEDYLPNDMEMNLMAEYHQRLNKDCTAYLGKKQAEAANGKSLSSYAKDRIELIKNVQHFSVNTRNIYRAMGDAEVMKANVKLAAQADEIKAFAGKMQLLDNKQATVDNMNEIAKNFTAFYDKNSTNKNMEPALKIYSKKLTEQIQALGGQDACKIDEAAMKKINDCFAKTNQPVKQKEVPEMQVEQTSLKTPV